jgi:hypothetical protein
MANLFEAGLWNSDAIRPAQQGESDKFSWNLYRFVRRHRPGVRERNFAAFAGLRFSILTIERGPASPISASPIPVPFDETSFATWQLFVGFVGDDRWAYGQRLSDILIGRLDILAYAPEQKPVRFTGAALPHDVTDWFWNGYLSVGRALWDPNGSDFMSGAEDRFEIIDADTKRCRWSGRVLTRRLTSETVVHETWLAA